MVAEIRLDEVLEPLAWYRDALCVEHDEVNFFPEQGERSAPAQSVCNRCLVRVECLAFALEHHIAVGVWGGLNANQRRQLKVERLVDRRTKVEVTVVRVGRAMVPLPFG